MKKDRICIFFLQLVLVILSLLHIFVFKRFSYIAFLLELLVIFGIVAWILNFRNRKERITKDVILVISIGVLLYWLIIYIIGYFSGFLYNSYSNSFMGITKNLFFATGLIVISELLRSLVLKNKNQNMKLLIMSVFVFSLLEIVTKTSLNQLVGNIAILKFVFSVIIPILSKNILLTFLTVNVGFSSSIIYRLLMELPLYVIPIIPNLGYYMENLIITILPLIILLILYKIYYSDDKKIKSSRSMNSLNKISNVLYFGIVAVLLVVILLVSGVGRYVVYTIGSGSMEKTISIGDVVCIDKKVDEFKENDIIAFYHNDVILVHRIVNIIKDDYGTYYQTKGDNNNDNDSWLVKDKEVVGLYKMRFRFIGWPTVMLNEWLLGGE